MESGFSILILRAIYALNDEQTELRKKIAFHKHMFQFESSQFSVRLWTNSISSECFSCNGCEQMKLALVERKNHQRFIIEFSIELVGIFYKTQLKSPLMFKIKALCSIKLKWIYRQSIRIRFYQFVPIFFNFPWQICKITNVLNCWNMHICAGSPAFSVPFPNCASKVKVSLLGIHETSTANRM